MGSTVGIRGVRGTPPHMVVSVLGPVWAYLEGGPQSPLYPYHYRYCLLVGVVQDMPILDVGYLLITAPKHTTQSCNQ